MLKELYRAAIKIRVGRDQVFGTRPIPRNYPHQKLPQDREKKSGQNLIRNLGKDKDETEKK